MYTTEQLNEVIKLLREAQDILKESNDVAENKEKMRLEQMEQRHSV
jgi:hypothetical protein